MFRYILLLFACMMADVVPRGHGGDGAGDSPPPGDGFLRGAHEQDVVPRKKTRGKGKNYALDKELKKRDFRPLELPFDTEITYHPVGQNNSYFTRELGIYMWRNIAFDREGWRNVVEFDKNALYEHLRGKFDLEKLDQELQAGLQQTIARRYSDRKNKAKIEFKKAGGYGDVERARARVPEHMKEENWQRAINHFLTPEHIKRSTTNAACRAQQKYNYRGGTCSYASRCYKESLSRIESFYKAHTDKDGVFDSNIAEQEYHKLVAEYDTWIQNADDEGEQSSKPNEVAIFENVMGRRRGHVRGIGPKPGQNSTPVGSQSQQPQFSKAYVDGLLGDPYFQSQLQQYFVSNSGSSKNANDDEDDEDIDLT